MLLLSNLFVHNSSALIFTHCIIILKISSLFYTARLINKKGVAIREREKKRETGREGLLTLSFLYNSPSSPSSHQVSSVRYAGVEDITFPTLTMYHDANQCGAELLVLRDMDALLSDFNDDASSFVVTGNSSWTVYQ